MAAHWNLPAVNKMVRTGPEWLLQILGEISEMERLQLLMTLWRVWHVRNEIVHDKRLPEVESSRRFLLSYVYSLETVRLHPHADHVKGKMVIGGEHSSGSSSRVVQPKEPGLRWALPPAGWTALSVDGSFCAHDETAGAGMVLRDSAGAIIFSSCRELRSCTSPLEAELEACREGIQLALQWTTLPIVLEMDSLEATQLVQDKSLDRSANAMLIEEIKTSLQSGREFLIKHIRREQNNVSHYMANFGRRERRTAVWLKSGPGDVLNICKADLPAA